jgi:hypothetical protein
MSELQIRTALPAMHKVEERLNLRGVHLAKAARSL